MKRYIKNPPVNMSQSFNDAFYNKNGAFPASNKHTIPVRVNRYFTDVNGTVIDKATVPASLQVRYPVFMFSQFDRNGGYKNSLNVTPPVQGTYFLMTYTAGINSPFLPFTGANTIKSKIQTGDVVTIYTDDIENPSYFVWIVITCQSVSYASILSNVETTQNDKRIGVLSLIETNYFVDVTAQFYQPLFFTNFDNIGTYKSDTLQPNMFLNPYVEQAGFLTLNTMYRIDQYIGLAFYMLFECDTLTMDFIVSKI